MIERNLVEERKMMYKIADLSAMCDSFEVDCSILLTKQPGIDHLTTPQLPD